MGTTALMILAFTLLGLWLFNKSLHHREFITLKRDTRSIQALAVFPRVRKDASVVILVHEIYGLTDWAKQMADELADEGFIVVAPDLLSGTGLTAEVLVHSPARRNA